MDGRQYRAVPAPDVCTRYTCSPKHLQVPLSSSMLCAKWGMRTLECQLFIEAVDGRGAQVVATQTGREGLLN